MQIYEIQIYIIRTVFSDKVGYQSYWSQTHSMSFDFKPVPFSNKNLLNVPETAVAWIWCNYIFFLSQESLTGKIINKLPYKNKNVTFRELDFVCLILTSNFLYSKLLLRFIEDKSPEVPFHRITSSYSYFEEFEFLHQFSLMCKKAKHCWALPTNFLFLFRWYFSLIMFCFLLNRLKNSNSSK